ncbi:MAG: phosphatase PAP2 family protein, partial [Pseudomonadota bacterium]|nr:phosphatase PAP2 family protein [Pseudomonadota bacterium]
PKLWPRSGANRGIKAVAERKAKGGLGRPVSHPEHGDTPTLDYYSFPSGHTLHAVSFTAVAMSYYPQLAWVLVPFTLLVASSRVVLGLHYPSDVLAAAGIGLALAYTSILLVP